MELTYSSGYDNKHCLSKIITNLLLQKKYIYFNSPGYPNRFIVNLNYDNKIMDMCIFITNSKINFQLFLPFTAEQYLSPLISQYASEYNKGTAFSKLQPDNQTGRLYYDYSYLVTPEAFKEDDFWTYWDSLIGEATKEYARLSHLSVGMISNLQKLNYIKQYKNLIKKLELDYDDETIEYGENNSSSTNDVNDAD